MDEKMEIMGLGEEETEPIEPVAPPGPEPPATGKTERPFYRCVMTTKGLELLSKQQLRMAQYAGMSISQMIEKDEGVRIHVTRAMAGEGWVQPTLLEAQTEVIDPIAEMELGPHELVATDQKAVRLRVRLSSEELNETALIRQVGVYAIDPDEGEILYSILQYRKDAPQPLSSVDASYGAISYFESEITLVFANGQATVIPQSPGWFATQEDIDWIYPVERVAVIEHGLGRYPRNIELYYARHALGVGGLGERGLGGDNLKSVPTFQVEQMDIYKVGIIVPRNYTRMGSLEVTKLSAPDDTILKYSLVPTVSTKKAESLYLMME